MDSWRDGPKLEACDAQQGQLAWQSSLGPAFGQPLTRACRRDCKAQPARKASPGELLSILLSSSLQLTERSSSQSARAYPLPALLCLGSGSASPNLKPPAEAGLDPGLCAVGANTSWLVNTQRLQASDAAIAQASAGPVLHLFPYRVLATAELCASGVELTSPPGRCSRKRGMRSIQPASPHMR